MKAKEIHDLLLSLFLRGLGIWLLYLSAPDWFGVVDTLDQMLFRPSASIPTDLPSDIWYLLGHLILVAYFVLGAPPFLQWATRNRKVD